jgi:hypothetical protein
MRDNSIDVIAEVFNAAVTVIQYIVRKRQAWNKYKVLSAMRLKVIEDN